MSPARAPLPRAPRLALRLTLTLGVALLSLLVLELALRVVAGPAQRHLTGPPNVTVTFRPDPAVLPGVSGPSRVAFDSRGLRGDELVPGRAPRVLCVGGSTTLCDYLDQDETWPAQLQARLGPPAWVGNAGRSGLTSRAHVLQLEALLPELGPLEVVLCLVGVNDLALALQEGPQHDPRGLERPELRAAVAERAFFDRPRPLAWWPPRATAIGRLLDRARRARWVADGAREDRLAASYSERRRVRAEATDVRGALPDLAPALEEYRRNLRRMAALARARGVRLVFLSQPTLWRADLPADLARLCWFGWIGREPWDGPAGYYSLAALAEGMAAYNAALRAVCSEEQVGLVDLAAALPRDGTVFYDDCHFNEAGAAQVAELVAAWLQEHPR